MILGIDPGSRYLGYGLIQTEKRKIISAGCDYIKIDPNKELTEKTLIVYKKINELISEYKPEKAAVETIFYGKNIKSAFILGHIRGVILLALAEKNIKAVDISPREVKKAVVGNGNASKKQVKYMIQKILQLKNKPTSEDASDGLAIAYSLYNRLLYKL